MKSLAPKPFVFLPAVLLAFASMGSLLQADTIVNGSFEDTSGLVTTLSPHVLAGVPHGWTSSQDWQITSTSLVTGGDGSFFLEWGNPGTGDGHVYNNTFPLSISQSITGLTPGTEYALSFYLGARSGTGAYSVEVDFGSSTFSASGSATEALTERILLHTPTSATETLTITQNSGGLGAAFDNFTLSSTAVPEPSSIALFSVCLAGLTWRCRRRAPSNSESAGL
ncbi:MAG: PEP-CTERM sorting domain-containing protein [Planctomycetota bacterium]